MGDRANVYIHDGAQPGVYLYTHWTGTELPSIVQKSLRTDRAVARSNDAAYLVRIVFEDLIAEDPGSETGYGVSPYILDGGDRIVDIDTQVGYKELAKVTLSGYPYTWDTIPDDPYNICDGCGRPL